MGWGSYLRLRVNIDITKPLDRGRALNLAGKTSWVEFKYEKMRSCCCYVFGVDVWCMGHEAVQFPPRRGLTWQRSLGVCGYERLIRGGVELEEEPGSGGGKS
jgi:hypothetical protein